MSDTLARRCRIIALLAVSVMLLVSACGGSPASGPTAIGSAQMARDAAGSDATTTFKPTDNPLHAVVNLNNVKDGTKVKAVWIAVDAGGAQGQKIVEKELTTSGLQNVLDFSASLPNDWPAGKYKTEIYLNDKLDRTLEWTVQ